MILGSNKDPKEEYNHTGKDGVKHMKISRSYILMIITCMFCLSGELSAQTTAFTYQGNLNVSSSPQASPNGGGTPATGSFDFEFLLFDAQTGGEQIGSILAREGVPVVNGNFTVTLDFGAAFPGTDRFLQIAVRSAGNPSGYTPLSPRTQLSSSPYAVKSLSSETAVNAAQLGGVPADQFITTATGGTNFIQNNTTQQAGANFNIGGTGRANIFNATSQYNINNSSVLSAPGISNIFLGFISGRDNTTGSRNAFIGPNAGFLNRGGSDNTFVGHLSGDLNQVGIGNTYVGQRSGRFFRGDHNSIVGFSSGQDVDTGESLDGNENTGIGAFVLFEEDLNNATAIGARAAVFQSNSIVLGSINGVNGALSNTRVGIGTSSPAQELHVRGPGDVEVMIDSTDAAGRRWSLQSGGATDGRFAIIDRTLNSNRLTILSNGFVGIGNSAPQDRLNVNGNVSLVLASGGSVSVCQVPASFRLATCSSSLRYKTNVNRFGLGLDLIRRLRPITFNWVEGGTSDLGLGAEDVAAVEPLLVTRNEKGEVEGVKYDRVGVVLVNAVNEQQDEIKTQQTEIEALKKKLGDQQAELDALKSFVCSQTPTAAICRTKNEEK